VQVLCLRGFKDFKAGSERENIDPRQGEAIVLARPDPAAIADLIECAVRRQSFATAKKSREKATKPKGEAADTAQRASAGIQALLDRISKQSAVVAGCCHKPHPSCRDVTLALVARYRQCWRPRGYSRGELLHSATLWPGEELTIEIFNWDRRRIERERSSETAREFSETGTFTVRASHEVVAAMQLKLTAGVEGKVGAEVSLEELDIPADVDGNIGANASTEITTSITSTTNRLSEATRTASAVLRESRKTRIVETEELGSEARTTRKLKNINPCHTLSFFTFEVLEEFEVSIDLAGIEYVVLVPIPELRQIDLDWVLCHEFPLRGMLLDPIYTSGFDAAKKLKSAQIFRDHAAPLLSPPAIPPAAGANDGVSGRPGMTVPDSIKDFVRPLVEDIRDAAARLRAAAYDENDVLTLLNPFANPDARDASEEDVSKALTKAFVVSVFPGIFNRVDELEAKLDRDGRALAQALAAFCRQVYSSGLINTASRPLKLEALPLLLFPYDDEGLVAAVDFANVQIKDLQPALAVETGAATLPATGAASESAPAAGEPRQTVDGLVDERYGLDALADAQVEFDRLVCHLKQFSDHYLSTIFGSMGRKGINALLSACPQARTVVEPQLLGFHGDSAIFRLRGYLQRRLGNEHLDELVNEIRIELRKQEFDCITLPTTGTVTIPQLGGCEACEDSVARKQVAEADHAVALARQAEAEANRLAERLASTPPLLDDPHHPVSALNVHLTQDGEA
jgi:hypothetical protein